MSSHLIKSPKLKPWEREGENSGQESLEGGWGQKCMKVRDKIRRRREVALSCIWEERQRNDSGSEKELIAKQWEWYKRAKTKKGKPWTTENGKLSPYKFIQVHLVKPLYQDLFQVFGWSIPKRPLNYHRITVSVMRLKSLLKFANFFWKLSLVEFNGLILVEAVNVVPLFLTLLWKEEMKRISDFYYCLLT